LFCGAFGFLHRETAVKFETRAKEPSYFGIIFDQEHQVRQFIHWPCPPAVFAFANLGNIGKHSSTFVSKQKGIGLPFPPQASIQRDHATDSFEKDEQARFAGSAYAPCKPIKRLQFS
jgi:hypothetical protein